MKVFFSVRFLFKLCYCSLMIKYSFSFIEIYRRSLKRDRKSLIAGNELDLIRYFLEPIPSSPSKIVRSIC